MEDKVSKLLSPAKLKAQISDGTELVCAPEYIVMTKDQLKMFIKEVVAEYKKEEKLNEEQAGNDEEMTMPEVAAYLDVSVWWVSRHCNVKHVGQHNLIPFRRKGRKFVFYKSQIDKWNSDRRDG